VSGSPAAGSAEADGRRPPQSAERHDLELVGHSDLGGCGDGMQVMVHGDLLYAGHIGPHGLSIVDVGRPDTPEIVGHLPAPPGASSAKVQIADGLLLTNAEQRGRDTPERTGLGIYDLADPVRPRPLGFWDTSGIGVHRMWYAGGRYAYVSAEIDGYLGRIFFVIDLDDPEHPVEVGRWWWPGQWAGGGEEPSWPEGSRFRVHHGIVSEGVAYTGLWDGGLVLLDVSDPTRPATINRTGWAPEEGGATHTALPLPSRGLVVVTDEAVRDNCQEPPKRIRVFDVARGEPRLLALFPVPEGDFCERGLWFGAHNLHENSPGTYFSESIIFATYANAGVRVYDLTDARRPVEVAHYVPGPAPGRPVCQSNDLVVDRRGLIYVSDRVGGGVSILRAVGALAGSMEQGTGSVPAAEGRASEEG
jgi:hypothetical protein